MFFFSAPDVQGKREVVSLFSTAMGLKTLRILYLELGKSCNVSGSLVLSNGRRTAATLLESYTDATRSNAVQE